MKFIIRFKKFRFSQKSGFIIKFCGTRHDMNFVTIFLVACWALGARLFCNKCLLVCQIATLSVATLDGMIMWYLAIDWSCSESAADYNYDISNDYNNDFSSTCLVNTFSEWNTCAQETSESQEMHFQLLVDLYVSYHDYPIAKNTTRRNITQDTSFLYIATCEWNSTLEINAMSLGSSFSFNVKPNLSISEPQSFDTMYLWMMPYMVVNYDRDGRDVYTTDPLVAVLLHWDHHQDFIQTRHTINVLMSYETFCVYPIPKHQFTSKWIQATTTSKQRKKYQRTKLTNNDFNFLPYIKIAPVGPDDTEYMTFQGRFFVLDPWVKMQSCDTFFNTKPLKQLMVPDTQTLDINLDIILNFSVVSGESIGTQTVVQEYRPFSIFMLHSPPLFGFDCKSYYNILDILNENPIQFRQFLTVIYKIQTTTMVLSVYLINIEFVLYAIKVTQLDLNGILMVPLVLFQFFPDFMNDYVTHTTHSFQIYDKICRLILSLGIPIYIILSMIKKYRNTYNDIETRWIKHIDAIFLLILCMYMFYVILSKGLAFVNSEFDRFFGRCVFTLLFIPQIIINFVQRKYHPLPLKFIGLKSLTLLMQCLLTMMEEDRNNVLKLSLFNGDLDIVVDHIVQDFLLMPGIWSGPLIFMLLLCQQQCLPKKLQMELRE